VGLTFTHRQSKKLHMNIPSLPDKGSPEEWQLRVDLDETRITK